MTNMEGLLSVYILLHFPVQCVLHSMFNQTENHLEAKYCSQHVNKLITTSMNVTTVLNC